jgi:hypothetical protein
MLQYLNGLSRSSRHPGEKRHGLFHIIISSYAIKRIGCIGPPEMIYSQSDRCFLFTLTLFER